MPIILSTDKSDLCLLTKFCLSVVGETAYVHISKPIDLWFAYLCVKGCVIIRVCDCAYT